MDRSLHVSFLPTLIEDHALTGGIAVIIDILRASSTITTALQNGASEVIPCGTPEEAFLKRERQSGRQMFLGGERGGVKIEGFDFGNSPAEYSANAVSGRTVAFTTTNGTKALLKSMSAEEILIGCFLNRRAVVDCLIDDTRNVHLICAGTDGSVTGEDVLFAGSIVDALQQRCVAAGSSGTHFLLNDSADIAMAFWKQASTNVRTLMKTSAEGSDSVAIEHAMRTSRGGLNLQSLGYGSDIALCSQTDVFEMVPTLNRERHSLMPRVAAD